ncbi:HpcH/HpaI aldolase family protein [Microbacterium sp. GXF6406]
MAHVRGAQGRNVTLQLREALRARRRLSGAWVFLDDPVTTQVMARSGFDFITIDLQHSYSTMHSAAGLVEAVRSADVPAVVRVPWNAPDLIMRSLDLGAQAVIVPMVNSAAEAEAAASACHYAPRGSRSWGPLWQGVHAGFPDHEQGDRLATCIVMIETAQAYADIEAIVAVADVDAVYIGQNDLSLSAGLGRTTYAESAVLHAMIERIIACAHDAGVAVGLDCAGGAAARYWFERGVDFVIAANDVALLGRAARDAALDLRDH